MLLCLMPLVVLYLADGPTDVKNGGPITEVCMPNIMLCGERPFRWMVVWLLLPLYPPEAIGL